MISEGSCDSEDWSNDAGKSAFFTWCLWWAMWGVCVCVWPTSLTVLSRVALRTGAVVFVWSRVTAGAAIQTGLQCAAGVQVYAMQNNSTNDPSWRIGMNRIEQNRITFVTELPSPVGVTQALPGFAARAVHTAGMRDALVTVLALPAVQTPVKGRASPLKILYHMHWNIKSLTSCDSAAVPSELPT